MLWLLSSVQLTELGEAEEAKVNYGNDAAIQYSTGEFSIDFVSSLDFGTNEISNQNQVYFAQAQRYYKSTLVTPNFIQITDNRGTLKGWTLKVYEKEQFKAEEYSQYQELKGTALSFYKPILVTNNNAQQPQAYEVRNLVPGVETLVAQAKVGEGAGTWIIRWGNKEDLFSRKFSTGTKDIQKYFTSSVSLYVPGDTPKEATTYRTNLTWILSELPDNQ